jgi:hypothetical protein
MIRVPQIRVEGQASPLQQRSCTQRTARAQVSSSCVVICIDTTLGAWQRSRCRCHSTQQHHSRTFRVDAPWLRAATPGCVQLPASMYECEQLISVTNSTPMPCEVLRCCTPADQQACATNNQSCWDTGPNTIMCSPGQACGVGEWHLMSVCGWRLSHTNR